MELTQSSAFRLPGHQTDALQYDNWISPRQMDWFQPRTAKDIHVTKVCDLTAWMEEEEEGKQSSAWDIICALAERGRLGYKEEELVCTPNMVVSPSCRLLTFLR